MPPDDAIKLLTSAIEIAVGFALSYTSLQSARLVHERARVSASGAVRARRCAMRRSQPHQIAQGAHARDCGQPWIVVHVAVANTHEHEERQGAQGSLDQAVAFFAEKRTAAHRRAAAHNIRTVVESLIEGKVESIALPNTCTSLSEGRLLRLGRKGNLVLDTIKLADMGTQSAGWGGVRSRCGR